MISKLLIFCLFFFSYSLSIGCPFCLTETGAAVYYGIFNNNFFYYLGCALIPFTILILLVSIIHSKKLLLNTNRLPDTIKTTNTLLTAGLLLGIGLGGFVDGIFFHQILQSHNMISNMLPPTTLVFVEINMFWDGIFHIGTLCFTIAGIIMLWKALNNSQNRSSNYLIGTILIGFGLFNIIEGIIDHHLIQLHHVIQQATLVKQQLADISFLLSGVIFIVVGFLIIKRS